jgi:ABC-type Fe3+-hydroxamate transport system substrate-binding protein
MVVGSGARVSNEQVASGAPEVMVLAWAATGAKAKAELAYEVAAWENVPAIRERRVFVVRDELLNTPGPPLIAGAKELYRILHRSWRATERLRSHEFAGVQT